MTAIDLSKHQACDSDTKAIQKISFNGNLEYRNIVKMYLNLMLFIQKIIYRK